MDKYWSMFVCKYLSRGIDFTKLLECLTALLDTKACEKTIFATGFWGREETILQGRFLSIYIARFFAINY